MLNINRLCPGCMKDNGGESVCSICGYDSSNNNPPDKLPARFIIRDRYYVGKVLFSNSESTVYLGFDTVENKAVNIREFFPYGLAERNPDKTVFVSRQAQYAFNEGLMSFLDINRRFIGFPLASLPSTYSVFEENSTGYAICETVSGITLKSFLARNGGRLRWEQARSLFLPLIDTVKAINDAGVVHGGISPESILVCRDGKLRLLFVPVPVSKQNREGVPAMTPLIYDGYSALEKYTGDAAPGNYTDVYSISATLFNVLIGTVPPPANERLKKDSLSIPSHFADELPRQVLVSLANGMQVKPEARTKDVETLKNELIYGETKENLRKAQRSAESPKAATAGRAAPVNTEEKKVSGVKYALAAAGITALVFLVLGALFYFRIYKPNEAKKNANGSKTDTSSVQSEPVSSEETPSDESSSKPNVPTYTVPRLVGKKYADIIDSKDIAHFKIIIKGKEFSNDQPAGVICSQSIQPGEKKEHDTQIEITISLGKSEFNMPNVLSMNENEAIIELLKRGLLFDNIEIVPAYDSDFGSGVVIKQEPEANRKINTETKVKVHINKYEDPSDGDDN